MSQGTEISSQITSADGGGKIIFAMDVIATIAGIAAVETDGIEALSGTVVEGLTGMLGKKNLTKGIKVDMKDDEVSLETSVSVKYGVKIHEVCHALQQNVKSAVETMTGLKVIAVNVSVQSVAFEKGESAPPKKEKEKEKEQA